MLKLTPSSRLTVAHARGSAGSSKPLCARGYP
jgi:hypothetical protein